MNSRQLIGFSIEPCRCASSVVLVTRVDVEYLDAQ